MSLVFLFALSFLSLHSRRICFTRLYTTKVSTHIAFSIPSTALSARANLHTHTCLLYIHTCKMHSVLWKNCILPPAIPSSFLLRSTGDAAELHEQVSSLWVREILDRCHEKAQTSVAYFCKRHCLIFFYFKEFASHQLWSPAQRMRSRLWKNPKDQAKYSTRRTWRNDAMKCHKCF